jgi:hypothetical protein
MLQNFTPQNVFFGWCFENLPRKALINNAKTFEEGKISAVIEIAGDYSSNFR